MPDSAHATLLAAEPALAPWIEAHGALPPIEPQPFDPVDALARAICHQQLSGKAAETIVGRLVARVGSARLDPAAFATVDDEALRGCGLSRAKTAAIRDLCAHAERGELPGVEELPALDSATLEARFTKVRGIGPWTVQMLLLFRLGRPDVWPIHDLGVRQGVMLLNGLEALPTPRWTEAYGAAFRPQASLMARWCWKIADLSKGRAPT